MNGSRTRGLRTRLLCVAAAVALLASCGNTPDKAQGWSSLYTAYQDQQAGRKSRQGAESGGTTASQARAVQSALDSIEGPLMLAVLEETKRTAILGEFGRNGPYRTWRTASMQTLSFREGVLTGTRGLGWELLSVDANPSIALITARKSGTVQRIYRHLSGENHEVPSLWQCEIAPAGTDNVTFATGETVSATIMKESCRLEEPQPFETYWVDTTIRYRLKVTNTYWVTGSGRIVQSIQWISPEVGKIALRTIRD